MELPTDALQKQKLKSDQLANDFEAVFGQPKKRTDVQKRVVGHLEVCAGDDGNSYRFNESKDGISIIAAGIHRDGAKSVLRVIERHISNAAKLRLKPKEAVQVKR